MEFLLINKWLILAFSLSGGYLLFSALKKGGGNLLSPVQVVNKINREKAIVVDIRDPETFDAGHLVGARNLPLSKLKTDGVSGLPKNKALPVIIVCVTGVSAKGAASYFTQDGYEQVFILAGGMGAWIKEEFPIEKTLTAEEKKTSGKDKKKSSYKKEKSTAEETKAIDDAQVAEAQIENSDSVESVTEMEAPQDARDENAVSENEALVSEGAAADEKKADAS